MCWADECLPQGWYLAGIDEYEFSPLTVDHVTRLILVDALGESYGRV